MKLREMKFRKEKYLEKMVVKIEGISLMRLNIYTKYTSKINFEENKKGILDRVELGKKCFQKLVKH